MVEKLSTMRYRRITPKTQRTTCDEKTTLCQNATATENRRRTLTLKNSRIRNGECLPKKVSAIRPRKNEEKANAVQELRPDYPLDLLLRYADLARSTFFYHLHGKDKTRDNNASLCAQILAIKQQNPHYGYRRVTKQLGEGSNHKRVQRLIQVMGLQVKGKRQRKYYSYRGEVGNIAPNHLQRDFHATVPHQKWLTDITEFKVKGDKLYFSPILDCYNNELIAYQCSRHPDGRLVKQMVLQAIARLAEGDSPILHSDQGIQYQMASYQQLLAEHHIVQSMSRKGNCLDNAAMESFFGRMKVECFYGKTFESIEELESVIKEYVRYYNEERIQLKLNGLSPVQYRIQSLK
ncbi:IS3 family transposase [Gallibacterium anatis]